MHSLNYSQIPGFLRAHPAFGRVFLADALSQLGHGLLLIAFPVLIHQATHDVTLTGLAFSGEILAFALLSPFAGYWADRLEQKALMVAANIGRVTILLALLGVLAARAPFWVCLLLSMLLGASAALFLPARAAFLRRLLKGEELLQAVALEGTMGFLIRVVSPAIIGLLLVAFPVTVAIWIDILLYLVSTVMLLPAWVTGPRVAPEEGAERPGAWREGWRTILGTSELRSLFLLDVIISLIGMAAWSTTVAFIVVALKLPDAYVGWLQAATGLAGAVGTRMGTRFGPRRSTYLGLLATITVSYLLVPLATTMPALVAIWLARGLAIGVFVVLFSQQIARLTPPEKMGRVQAAWDMAVCVSAFLGSAATVWLLRELGPAGSFALFGVLMLLVTAAWWALRAGAVRRARRPVTA
ncbi:MAG: hypothetical protein AMXMBFR33_68650 [Candidatus Xenobia bacterium]